MTTFDIFNPQVSRIAKGLEGKAILIYGNNSTGKTYQSAKMPKPFYLGFEEGLRAINGIPFLPINKWSDFIKINKQLTDPKTIDAAKEVYQTIIFDEVYAASRYCQDYLCKKLGIESIGEYNNGFGAWKQYENAFYGELDKLLKSGYTLAFIGHEQFSKDEDKIVPKGDARSMGVIRDNCDIIVYLQSNGVDENGKAIKSSGYFAETPEYFARSRFEHIVPYIEEFTAENLEKAIRDAVVKQEEADGVKAVTYEEQKESLTSEELNYEELMDEIKQHVRQLRKAEKQDELQEVIEKHLGKDALVSECTKNQVEIMAVILDDMKDLLSEIKD